MTPTEQKSVRDFARKLATETADAQLAQKRRRLGEITAEVEQIARRYDALKREATAIASGIKVEKALKIAVDGLNAIITGGRT